MIKDGVYQTAAARPIVPCRPPRRRFEIKPENMFEMFGRGLGLYSPSSFRGSPVAAHGMTDQLTDAPKPGSDDPRVGETAE